MKVVFDPRPLKTFTLQVSFSMGWRHETAKNMGSIRRSLEGFVEDLKGYLPSWTDVFYHVDAEFSSVVVMGLSESAEETLRKFSSLLEGDLSDFLEDFGARGELVVACGGLKKELLDYFEGMELGRRSSLKLQNKPRRFLSLKELSRPQRHFFVFMGKRYGYELYLEVSKVSDRVQYGMKLSGEVPRNLESEMKVYEFYLRRRFESTKDSAALLTLMNVYGKGIVLLEDILESVKNVNVSSLMGAFKTLQRISSGGRK